MFIKFDRDKDNRVDLSELAGMLESINLAPNAFPEVFEVRALEFPSMSVILGN